MEFEERNKKAEASGGPHLLVGYDKLLYMSRLQGVPLQGVPLQGVPLQGVPGDDEYGSQDLDVKFTHLKTEHITRLKREVIEILSSCEGKCLKLSQFKSKYNRRFKKKFNESYMLSGGRKEYWNLMAELDIIEFDQNGSRPRIKLKEPHTSQFMQRTSLNTAEELYSSSNFGYQLDEFDSKVPTKSRRPATLADDLAVAAGPIISRVPTVPLAPSDQRVLDSGVQFPAPATTFHASPPLVWSPSLMQDPSHAANIPEGM